MSELTYVPDEQMQRLGHGEFANTFPEIEANSVLPNVTFVPLAIVGENEWENGNMLRSMRSFLSQQVEPNENSEMVLLTNTGRRLGSSLLVEPNKNEDGKYAIRNEPTNELEQNLLDTLEKLQAPATYAEMIVTAQGLAQKLQTDPSDVSAIERLNKIRARMETADEREVLELAIKKADTLGFVAVDATHTLMGGAGYGGHALSALRTMAADIGRTRYGDNTVFSLWDIDTVYSNNRAIRDTQRIYRENPGINYLFNGMSYLPVGHSPEFAATGPTFNVKRTHMYSGTFGVHGSPQITFRAGVYDQLQEISGWSEIGFIGDEDRDTSQRLLYHYGKQQAGILADTQLASPVVMSSERLDGALDSAVRLEDFEEEEYAPVTEDLGRVITFRNEVTGAIAALPAPEQEKALAFLDKSRAHYLKQEHVQQRFNRLTLQSFVTAVESGYISVTDSEIQVEQDQVAAMPAGVALRMYVDANPDVVKGLLDPAESNLDVLRYLLDRRDTLPDGVTILTPFQSAIREYIGDVKPFAELEEEGIIHGRSVGYDDKWEGYVDKWEVDDKRTADMRLSLMHSGIAELLALSRTHQTFLEAEQFWTDGQYSRNADVYPDDPADQRLKMHFAPLAKRLENVRDHYPDIAEVTEDRSVEGQPTEDSEQTAAQALLVTNGIRTVLRHFGRRKL